MAATLKNPPNLASPYHVGQKKISRIVFSWLEQMIYLIDVLDILHFTKNLS